MACMAWFAPLMYVGPLPRDGLIDAKPPPFGSIMFLFWKLAKHQSQIQPWGLSREGLPARSPASPFNTMALGADDDLGAGRKVFSSRSIMSRSFPTRGAELSSRAERLTNHGYTGTTAQIDVQVGVSRPGLTDPACFAHLTDVPPSPLVRVAGQVCPQWPAASAVDMLNLLDF